MPKMSALLSQDEIEKVRVVLDVCLRHHENPEVAASGGDILAKVAADVDLDKQDIARTGAMCGMVAQSSDNWNDRVDLLGIMQKLQTAMNSL